LYGEDEEVEVFIDAKLYGLDENGGGVGGSGGGGLADLGEEIEDREYLESGMGREDANDAKLLLNGR
jgi:hypothetical protein